MNFFLNSRPVEMDQETAQVLFREGAIMVCLDVPEGTEFGIDYASWTVGPQFKGIKMIPPGIHFIYYRYSPVCICIYKECICTCTYPSFILVSKVTHEFIYRSPPKKNIIYEPGKLSKYKVHIFAPYVHKL